MHFQIFEIYIHYTSYGEYKKILYLAFITIFILSMEYSTTKRGKLALIYQVQRYVKNRRGRDGRIFWRCGVSMLCSGAVTTMSNEILSQRDIHNHLSDIAEIEAEKIVCRLRVAVKESIYTSCTNYLP